MSDRFYFDAGADGYDRSFGKVSPTFIQTLVQAAHLETGQRVLDVATGTGIAAEAAAEIVGPSGHVIATDISVPILDQARIRLATRANVSFAIEGGQALSFPRESFDAVLCSMGLMLFHDPTQGLSEFHRVLRGGRRARPSPSARHLDGSSSLGSAPPSRGICRQGRRIPPRSSRLATLTASVPCSVRLA